MCTGNVLPFVFECIEQLEFLYRGPKPDPRRGRIPCYRQCRRCRRCLLDTGIELPQLNATLWETVYRDAFSQQSRPEEIDSSESSSSSDDDDSRRRRE